MIRCIIVEDFLPLREAYATILSAAKDIELVAAFENGAQLMKWLRNRPDDDPGADVILLDIEMESGKDGIDTCKKVALRYPAVKCVMLTCHEEEELIIEALESGATDYLSKNAAPSRIMEAIRSAQNGVATFDANVSSVLRHYLHDAQKRHDSMLLVINKLSRLTASEADVLRAVLEGKSKAQIARERCVEYGTVKVQISSILRKFNCVRMAQVTETIKEQHLEHLLGEDKQADETR